MAAAVAVAREHGLRVEEPVVLNDRFSVQVHLAPAPVVAGISTWTAMSGPTSPTWLARKVAVTDHLEAVGAPVVGNSRELPPGPHLRDGLTMTFTEWAPPDADRTPDAADCVAMLPDLHAALATYPGELPLLAPVHEDVPYGLAALERHPDVLSTEERDRLLAAHERLAPFAAALGGTDGSARRPPPRQPARHRRRAALARPRGRLPWPGGLRPRAAAVDGPDRGRRLGRAEQLARCSDLRAVYLALCLLAFRDVFGDDPEWDGYIRWFVQQIHS